MNQSAVKYKISSTAIWVPVVVTLFVTTGINIDPVNLPKMVVLAISAGYLIGLMSALRFSIIEKDKVISALLFVFILGLIISTIFSKSPLVQVVYGSTGRNTGLITYLSLVILIFACLHIDGTNLFRKAIWGLFATGFINSIYGFMQINNLDPIDWNNNFKAIIGTLGNPNFSSAIIALSALTVPYLASTVKSLQLRIALLLAFVIDVFAVFKTTSQQGFIFLALGLAIILVYTSFKKDQLRKFAWPITFLTAASGLTGLLGIFQIGPLTQYVYQPSVSLRGFYWHAGLSMFQDSILFGHGLDSYGDLYLRHRSPASILSPGGVNVFSNASHNVFIDLAASGGLVLIVPYISLIVYIAIKAVKLIKSSKFDIGLITIFALWFAFQIESIMSINQIGIAVWTWALSGLLISRVMLGSELNSNIEEKSKKRKPTKEVGAGTFLISFALSVLAAFIVLPEQIADMNFKSGMASHDVVKIEKNTEEFPLNSDRMSRTAQVFLQNSLNDNALRISLRAVKFNPDSLNSWITVVSNPSISPTERLEARNNLERLDPLNPNWKKI